jgi:hypothetical protein
MMMMAAGGMLRSSQCKATKWRVHVPAAADPLMLHLLLLLLLLLLLPSC